MATHNLKEARGWNRVVLRIRRAGGDDVAGLSPGNQQAGQSHVHVSLQPIYDCTCEETRFYEVRPDTRN